MQELAVAVEERPGDRDRQEQRGERESQESASRNNIHQTNVPGLHREGLPAAQPAPEEVGGEHGADEELERVPAPAGSRVLGATHEEEDPGGEEGDGEEQDRLVRHGSEPPG